MKVLPITKSVKITEVDIGTPLRNCGGRKTHNNIEYNADFCYYHDLQRKFPKSNQYHILIWKNKFILNNLF